MSGGLEVVWHGGLWREASPQELPTTEEEDQARAFRSGWTRPTGTPQITKLLEAIGTDWTDRRTILAAVGSTNERHTSALLTRLWQRGKLERQAVRGNWTGRPSYRYRRRQTEAA